MKILVFEYITGGGFNKHELPDSLAGEGNLMLDALLKNLSGINDIEVTVMLDWRLHGSVGTTGINTVNINPEHDISEEFARLVQQSDAVWPIAPEFDGILQTLCQTVESLGKILLTSPASAVAIAGNKFKTYEQLSQHHIVAVPTRMFEDSYFPGEWMVKPVDGVGCADSYVITNRQDFEQMSIRKGHDCMASTAPGSLAAFPPSMEVKSGGTTPWMGEVEQRTERLPRAMQGAIAEYVIQPHLQGKKTSLSCLFKQGSGWLVCANLQRFEFIDKQYRLAEIMVNHHADSGMYQQLVDKIAHAFPELWGYVGIDLIETDQQIWVLEINPRLTTSFVGIHAALGINVAEAVLQLLNGKPILNPVHNQPITIKVKQETGAS